MTVLERSFSLALKGEDACRNCGSKRWVAAHHAIPRGIGTRETRLDLRNLLPLCEECHRGWHAHELVIYRDVFTEEEWVYLCSVELTGRETLAWLDDHYPERHG